MRADDLIKKGEDILECTCYEEAKSLFDLWKKEVESASRKWHLPSDIKQDLKIRMHFVENEFSVHDSRSSMNMAIKETMEILASENETEAEKIQEDIAVIIVERILTNFYLYIKTMYKAEVHKRGTLQKVILDEITIGNEYDVQRLLYAILIPVFPEARTEVNGDNGYSGIRTDIYLEKYDLAIEIKCTRDNMSEKELTDQLGADGFHYHMRNLYMFIYDKANIIRNVEAYKAAFAREYEKDGIRIRMVIIQPVQLL